QSRAARPARAAARTKGGPRPAVDAARRRPAPTAEKRWKIARAARLDRLGILLAAAVVVEALLGGPNRADAPGGGGEAPAAAAARAPASVRAVGRAEVLVLLRVDAIVAVLAVVRRQGAAEALRAEGRMAVCVVVLGGLGA